MTVGSEPAWTYAQALSKSVKVRYAAVGTFAPAISRLAKSLLDSMAVAACV